MPRKRPGTWEGKPHFRWVRMVKGVRHRVTCMELGLPESQWTEQGSIKAASEWMEKKLAELTSQPPLDPINQQIANILDGTTPDELRQLARQGAEAKRILAVLEDASVANEPRPESYPGKAAMPVAERAALPISEDIITSGLAGGNPYYTADENQEVLARIEKNLSKPKVETLFTLRHHADQLLEVERARDTKATTYRELKTYVDKLVEMLGNVDARSINEQTVTQVYLKIKGLAWANLTKRKAWRIFRRLVKYLFTIRLIELPRNLDDGKLSFKVVAKKIKRYSKEEVQAELKALPERLRLYALLGLNCGMLGVDMASIRWDELDQVDWRIKRKRTKTGDNEHVPEVNYKLWKETKRLLKKHLSKHESFVLASKTGTLLWEAWVDEHGNPKKKDLIVVQWRRRKHKIGLKAFRSIGATIIGDHKEYGRYYSHYLGHSPKSIGDKHYVPPSDDLFDEIMAYVGKELGLA